MLSICNKVTPIARVLKTKAPVLAVMARQLTYVHPEQRLHQKLAAIHNEQISKDGISELYNKRVPFDHKHPEYRLKVAKTLYDLRGPSEFAPTAKMPVDQVKFISHNYLPPLHKNDSISSGAVVTNRLRAKTEDAMEKIMTSQ